MTKPTHVRVAAPTPALEAGTTVTFKTNSGGGEIVAGVILDSVTGKRLFTPKFGATRICPECGITFEARHGKAVFCCTDHQKHFHHVMQVRGKVAMPFALVWRTGKRGRSAERSYALSELSRLMDEWNAEDLRVGRRPDLIVAAKMREKWTAADRQMNRPNCFAPVA